MNVSPVFQAFGLRIKLLVYISHTVLITWMHIISFDLVQNPPSIPWKFQLNASFID